MIEKRIKKRKTSLQLWQIVLGVMAYIDKAHPYKQHD